jgi:hypothetical protein
MLRIGGISDTHGLLRPQALAALQGSDYIVHGGTSAPATSSSNEAQSRP